MNAKIKLVLFKSLAILLSVTVLAIVAEIVLRFFPVTESFRSLPVNDENLIARCQPNRIVKWSAFANFSMRNFVKVNNYGFISNLDYDPHGGAPLLAIIGDSFVEALAVPWPETGAARLHQRLANRGRVYAFGKSGAPLSQYLAVAEYVKRTFRPEGLIIIVVGNDFDESLVKYMRMPGFHYFVTAAAGDLLLERVDYEVGLLKEMMRRSALFMYLLVNAQLPGYYQAWKYHLTKAKFVENAPAFADSARLAESKRAVKTFLSLLPAMSGLQASRILFVVDGMRPQLYNDQALRSAAGSYFAGMRRYFIENAVAQGFEVIDMQPIFVRHYKEHGQRFEFPRDNHWNNLGHELFVGAVVGSKVFSRFYAPPE